MNLKLLNLYYSNSALVWYSFLLASTQDQTSKQTWSSLTLKLLNHYYSNSALAWYSFLWASTISRVTPVHIIIVIIKQNLVALNSLFPNPLGYVVCYAILCMYILLARITVKKIMKTQQQNFTFYYTSCVTSSHVKFPSLEHHTRFSATFVTQGSVQFYCFLVFTTDESELKQVPSLSKKNNKAKVFLI